MRNDYYYDEIEKKTAMSYGQCMSYVKANAFKNFCFTSIMYM